jgi:3-hydroxymyristoyl/3-hydroxydecanoyl-(acyl carrier protein) dehydratase
MAVDGHFRAFSFVDRIGSLEPGTRLRGSYCIPAGIPAFPTALVTEAVGQLAAWGGMSALNFQSRPVAGLAARIDFLSTVRPGQTLELAVELDTVEADAIAYHGTALADGVPVAQLHHCVGPMVSVEEFDDPQALRDRFHLLCGPGATPGAFNGIPPLPLEDTGGEDGKYRRATLRVPHDAPFFADHFPRRPVLPGVLLMGANLELVAALAARFPAPSAGGSWVLQGVSNVKLRSFMPPGEILEIEARLEEISAGAASVTVETRNHRRVVGGSSVRLVPGGAL